MMMMIMTVIIYLIGAALHWTELAAYIRICIEQQDGFPSEVDRVRLGQVNRINILVETFYPSLIISDVYCY